MNDGQERDTAGNIIHRPVIEGGDGVGTIKEIDTFATEFPVCPHCGFEHEVCGTWYEWERDCEECGKPFHLTICETTTYTTCPVEEVES